MLVTKFGGSILNGADGVGRACDEIARLPRPLVVVVSAFADVTNRLERLAAGALTDPVAAQDELRRLFDDHARIAAALMPAADFERWSENVAGWKARLGEVVEGLSIVGELSPRTLDLVVHYGERLSSSILSAVLGFQCISATDLLITDGTHRYARVEIELSRERVEENLRPLLRNGSAVGVVTEGYIARGVDGEVTTMGRESSDFSAALLGELLGASEVRIYTGVPGVMTADPAIIREALTVPSMSYGMARELAVLGAKVLHPRTVRPAERAKIPLTIIDLDGSSTVIGRTGDEHTFSVAAIGDAGLVVVELRQTGESIDEFIRELSRTAPIVRYVLAGRVLHVVTAVEPSNLNEAIARTSGGIVSGSVSPVALVSLVREGTIAAADAREFVAAVDGEALLSLWTDPDERSISALVRPERAEAVVRELHGRMVGG